VNELQSRTEMSPRHKTVLIVEDEILIRLLLAEELASAGFQVIQAANADEALRVLESSVTVDLMFSDIRMPGTMDGLGLAERVRSTWPGIKIALTSGHLPELPAGAPADLFIPKPYQPARIGAALHDLLGSGTNDLN